MDVKKSEIAEEISRLCEERNITSYELAKRSGLQESSVRNMFQKGTTPTYRTLLKICEGLGLTIPQFFDRSSFLEKRDTPITFFETPAARIALTAWRPIVTPIFPAIPRIMISPSIRFIISISPSVGTDKRLSSSVTLAIRSG